MRQISRAWYAHKKEKKHYIAIDVTYAHLRPSKAIKFDYYIHTYKINYLLVLLLNRLQIIIMQCVFL